MYIESSIYTEPLFYFLKFLPFFQNNFAINDISTESTNIESSLNRHAHFYWKSTTFYTTQLEPPIKDLFPFSKLISTTIIQQRWWKIWNIDGAFMSNWPSQNIDGAILGCILTKMPKNGSAIASPILPPWLSVFP